MKKLLIVSAISPVPKKSGGAVRIYNEIKELSDKFELYFIGFKEPQIKENKELAEFLNKYTKQYALVEMALEKSNHINRSKGIPYWFSDYYQPEAILLLTHFINMYEPDIVQVEFTQLLYLLNFIPTTTFTVFVAHDVAAISFARRADEVESIINRFKQKLLLPQIKHYEKKYLPKSDLVVAMSENDKEILQKKYKIKEIIVVPNGAERTSLNKPKKVNKKEMSYGYIGSFSHSPNYKAVKYFFQEIAPRLRDRGINFKYYLAGDNSDDEIRELLLEPEFINLGFVKDVSEFYEKIDYLVAPIFSGSGTRVKILESISHGTPVVTTPIGAEGLGENSNIYVLNTKNEILEIISEIVAFNINEIGAISWKNIYEEYAKSIISNIATS